ncbi:uncharacterized protein LOC128954892 [Oppia nitens]|uniref:uncharacterized protein LOC128954892 n=1 Tax=Oppia nitens TaxID=1686743 RepID=UPI0023DA456B|nr:uncharacterized protein LOC128954892 [Oppia nitens]
MAEKPKMIKFISKNWDPNIDIMEKAIIEKTIVRTARLKKVDDPSNEFIFKDNFTDEFQEQIRSNLHQKDPKKAKGLPLSGSWNVFWNKSHQKVLHVHSRDVFGELHCKFGIIGVQVADSGLLFGKNMKVELDSDYKKRLMYGK